MTDMRAGSSAALREFLEWASRSGVLNPTTGNAFKVAVGKVLEDEDDPEGVDVRSLDMQEVLRRFEARHRADYTSGSMSTYQTRFRQAILMYRDWLNDDPGWKSVVRSRQKTSAFSSQNTELPRVGLPASSDVDVSEHGDVRDRLVKHSFPLRPDMLIQIELPVHLTRVDADRIAAFVKSLAFDHNAEGRTD